MKLKIKLTALLFICLLSISNISAQQEGFIGEVKMFAGNFAPRGWAYCDGQLLSIAQNQALFSVIGTIYGGDGRTTFALPDLRGRVAMGPRTGPGLTTRVLGQRFGVQTMSLNLLNLPSHTHTAILSSFLGAVDIPVNTESGGEDDSNPGSGVLANNGKDRFSSETTTNAKYGGQSVPVSGTGNVQIGPTGNNAPFNIIQPVQVINYIICLQGQYPSRS